MHKSKKQSIHYDSKPERSSYLNRYRQKNQIGQKSMTNLMVGNMSKWSQLQISERRDKIIEKIYKENEVSRMRIEDQSIESQFVKDEYLDLEIMWFKKIDQIKEETHKIKSINNKEVRNIKNLEESVKILKSKVEELEHKLSDGHRYSQETAVEEESESYQFQKQSSKLVVDLQKEVKSLEKDKEELQNQNYQIQESIVQLQNQISRLQKCTSKDIRAKMRTKMLQKQNLKIELKNLQMQNEKLSKELEKQSIHQQINEQDLSEYITVAEQIFIIKKLDKIESLMKQKQFEKMQQTKYQQYKEYYKNKRKAVQSLQDRCNELKQLQQNLTEQIKQVSINMLNLYTY